MDHSRGNFRGGYRGRGGNRERGNYHGTVQHYSIDQRNQYGYQHRGRGRVRGDRHLNPYTNTGLHAKSFEEILKSMTNCSDEKGPNREGSLFQTNRAVSQKCNSRKETQYDEELSEDIIHKYRPLIKIDTPEELARWIENRKKNYPTAANIAKKRKRAEEDNAKINPPPIMKNSIGIDYSGSDSESEAKPTAESINIAENVSQSTHKQEDTAIKITSQTLKRKICKYYQNGNCSRGKSCSLVHSEPQAVKRVRSHKHDHLFSKLQETEAKQNAPILLQALRLLNLLAVRDLD